MSMTIDGPRVRRNRLDPDGPPDLPGPLEVVEELDRREADLLLAERDGPWPPPGMVEAAAAGPVLAGR